MGYPMTYRRLVSRNGLGNGGYSDAGDWEPSVNLDHPGLASEEEFDRLMVDRYRETIKGYRLRASALIGDLRRLEEDAVDERTICKHIAHRTGVDTDTVAIILKEFMQF